MQRLTGIKADPVSACLTSEWPTHSYATVSYDNEKLFHNMISYETMATAGRSRDDWSHDQARYCTLNRAMTRLKEVGQGTVQLVPGTVRVSVIAKRARVWFLPCR